MISNFTDASATELAAPLPSTGTPGLAGCDIYEMGSGNVGISVGNVSAVFNPLSSVLRYTASGRAPIVITGSGRAHELPESRTDFTVTLSRGTSAFFYSTERSPHPALEAALALHHVARPDSNVEKLEYTAHPICASLAREAMRVFAIHHGLEPERQYELSFAVGEAVANAIEYCVPGAEATFKIDAVADSEKIVVHVENSGCWRPSVPTDERGRGITIMAACSKALEIDSSDDRTRITLTFAI